MYDPVMPPSPTLGRLLAEWEVMSEHHLAGRTQLVRRAVEELRRRAGDRGATLVELGSGPGSLLRELTSAIPTRRSSVSRWIRS